MSDRVPTNLVADARDKLPYGHSVPPERVLRSCAGLSRHTEAAQKIRDILRQASIERSASCRVKSKEWSSQPQRLLANTGRLYHNDQEQTICIQIVMDQPSWGGSNSNHAQQSQIQRSTGIDAKP